MMKNKKSVKFAWLIIGIAMIFLGGILTGMIYYHFSVLGSKLGSPLEQYFISLGMTLIGLVFVAHSVDN